MFDDTAVVYVLEHFKRGVIYALGGAAEQKCRWRREAALRSGGARGGAAEQLCDFKERSHKSCV